MDERWWKEMGKSYPIFILMRGFVMKGEVTREGNERIYIAFALSNSTHLKER